MENQFRLEDGNNTDRPIQQVTTLRRTRLRKKPAPEP